MKIYDCFTFYNELDLLEIRLDELSNSVDIFVIVEANVTFQGKDKPLYFYDNRRRFAKYADKIRHVVVEDVAAIDDPWQREWAQRNAIKRGLGDAEDGDSVIVSDVDEIVRASTIESAASVRDCDFCFLEMQLYAYFLNWKALPWIKPYMAPWSVINAMPDLNEPRHETRGTGLSRSHRSTSRQPRYCRRRMAFLVDGWRCQHGWQDRRVFTYRRESSSLARPRLSCEKYL